ncbi:MAG: HlyC/CorC family transporter [Clostridia bacterium]|nr:HlyC/CorC family transporter [Clostridia bacterium]
MPDGTPSLLIAIIILILFSSFFSSTETAYTSLNVIKVKSLALKNKNYQRVLNLYEKYDRLISTILVGNNIVNITASSLAVLFFQKILSEGANYSLVSTAVVTVVVLIFGEITPKMLAKAMPEKMASFSYPLMILFYYVLYPLTLIFSGISTLVGKIFKVKNDDTITDDELITIVNEATEDGTLKEEESDLIRSAIEFDDLEVKDILIPRINVLSVSLDAEKSEIKKLFENERYSRLPVYDGNIDSIVGIIHQKDFYKNYTKKDFNIKNIMQEVVFVVEHTKISVLLRKLQLKKMHMAVVLDEYGGTMGIVTVEDIIEELVGEIYDEYDEFDEEIVKNDDDTYLVNCKMSLDNFFEHFNLIDEVEEFDANTVGGWVTEQFGELPIAGKEFNYQNLTVKVVKATRKKVIEVKVTVNETAVEELEKDE